MRVADSAGERVRRIGGRIPGQSEQAPDHVLDLFFFGVAIADHRLLHLERSVLGDRQPGEDGGADGGAARLAERKSRLRVDVDEHLLDRDLDRSVLGDDLVQPVEDRLQPRGEIAAAGFYAAARHVAQAGAALLGHPAADVSPSRIVADNPPATAFCAWRPAAGETPRKFSTPARAATSLRSRPA